MTAYLWLKAFHIIFVVTWFAGIFYLPRLFVYHSQTSDPVTRTLFGTMERKLYRIIMTPSMIATLLLGSILFIDRWSALSDSAWIWLKLVAVGLLIAYHFYSGSLIHRLAATTTPDQHPHSERFFRLFNEIPALLLIIIVLLAVTKPF
jgi:putative membrane protein